MGLLWGTKGGWSRADWRRGGWLGVFLFCHQGAWRDVSRHVPCSGQGATCNISCTCSRIGVDIHRGQVVHVCVCESGIINHLRRRELRWHDGQTRVMRATCVSTVLTLESVDDICMIVQLVQTCSRHSAPRARILFPSMAVAACVPIVRRASARKSSRRRMPRCIRAC